MCDVCTRATAKAHRLPTYVGVDLSSPTRPGNFIGAVGLELATRRRVMLEARFGNWSSSGTAAALADVCAHHDVQFIQVENNAYQQSLIDWIQQAYSGRAWSCTCASCRVLRANPGMGSLRKRLASA